MAPAKSEQEPAWLSSLPSAPEFRPSLIEFLDPISYLAKISDEASRFGLCKIIPPLNPPTKKSVLTNLTRSFASLNPNKPTKRKKKSTSKKNEPSFSVSPSGDYYTLQQFEAKSKEVERDYLKKKTKNRNLSALELEALFWKENLLSEQPITVDHARGIPGSGFQNPVSNIKKWTFDETKNVGETDWNLRIVSKSNLCPLKFVKEEIHGVNSPVVDLGMFFSWCAWSLEDHELYRLDYLHIGAGRSWYGVPRDASFAFEEAVRVNGYEQEVNPLVTYAILGEKTTLMSPEILVESGIPCCRLIQNPGEFVVTFPGAYYSAFCHGYNCGEKANVATPDWLRVAKEAAIRRACINHPPILSHYQLLYSLALSLHSRMPLEGNVKPRSSRLKDKNETKGQGKDLIKKLFVQNVILNNHHLNSLLDGSSSCVILPKSKPNQKEEEMERSSTVSTGEDLLDQELLLSCVTCGVLSFSCVAVIKPNEKAAKFLMRTDQNSLAEYINQKRERKIESEQENPVQASNESTQSISNVTIQNSDTKIRNEISALDLLASNYGDMSDSDDDEKVNSLTGTESHGKVNPLTPQNREKVNSLTGIEMGFSSSSVNYSNNDSKNNKNNDNNIITYKRYRHGNNKMRCDKDSSRMHVFCLEHAIEVQGQIRKFGGADVMLLCHPEYPRIEEEAKLLAEELQMNYNWNEIKFKQANKLDKERINETLKDEESVPNVNDWAVKLGFNLYFSANLCMSPPYRKEKMPFNKVIYESFRCNNYEENENGFKRKMTRQKKTNLVGQWCGKNWFVNQVHPFLTKIEKLKNSDEELVEKLCFQYNDGNDENTPERDMDDIEIDCKLVKTPKTKPETKPKKKPLKKKSKIEEEKNETPLLSPNGMVLRSCTAKTLNPNTKPNSSKFKSNKSEQTDNPNQKPQPKSKKRKLTQQTDNPTNPSPKKPKTKSPKMEFKCQVQDCEMTFRSKQEFDLHKKNICHVANCNKKLFSHKYMKSHMKVHLDERPLKCPWKDCEMRFKWSWARTEHLRVHTGDRPYICTERGCGKTFRFVSDFSRHKRNTGHLAGKGKGW
ncbi:hypothetical protein LUZ60_015664 [Juncus effusus]|nr:hypothetical protein LUZ60_015664 [Juncus effusus]